MKIRTRGGRTWAVVLAAGEGARLRGITRDRGGRHVPKQFCAVDGRTSLLERTLDRASMLVPSRRAVTIVAARHREWWRETLRRRPVVVQPENRGTAAGILLAALCVQEEDPAATLVFLPSDHWVPEEAPLIGAARQAVLHLRRHPGRLLLLGVTPTEADPELGYIVPGAGGTGAVQPVRAFVEKPAAAVASRLLQDGALWNSFILVVRATTLIRMFADRAPATLAALRAALRGGRPMPWVTPALREAYARLQDVDFSRAILQHCVAALDVVRVPPCGWTDLGTPQRIAGVLAAPADGAYRGGSFHPASPILDAALPA